MLYVTTRSNCETYTAARTLTADTAPDGGLFVPFQIPRISFEALQGHTQEAIIAYVLGLFFRTKLSEEAVLFALGGTPLRRQNIDRKVTVARLWNSRRRSFARIEYDLYCKLCLEVPPCGKVTQWPKIAIRIAVLTALIASEGREVDVAVNAGDFLSPMAAYYCRQMGIPIGKILCVTNENSNLWDFFTHGELDCGVSLQQTSLPQLDVTQPSQLERLIFDVSGLHSAKKFAAHVQLGDLYKCDDLRATAENFAVSVVSTQRVPSVIHRIYRSNGYVLDPYTALTFGGLQDYRATSFEIRQTLLLAENSPTEYRTAVSAALGVPEFKLSDLV